VKKWDFKCKINELNRQTRLRGDFRSFAHWFHISVRAGLIFRWQVVDFVIVVVVIVGFGFVVVIVSVVGFDVVVLVVLDFVGVFDVVVRNGLGFSVERVREI
jgi:hypothetical protein